jgi:uncharacterized RDD family membrane protein YckC
MSYDPSQQPSGPPPPPPPPGPQGAPVPPPPGPQGSPYGQPQGTPYQQQPQPGYAPAPYAGAPAYGYGPQLPPALQGQVLADYGSRVGAYLLDAVFVVFTIGIGLIVNWFLMGREGEKNGQTLGKGVVGVRVVKEDGTPVTTGFAVLRDFVVRGLLFGTLGLFFFGLPGLLDLLWPLWDDKNQTLTDKIVSTYVTKA